MEVRNVYYPHHRVQNDPGGKSLTKQAFKDEVDINNILRKHEKGLLVDHVNEHKGDYGDFIDAPDYHTALNRIHDAQASFLTVPAEIRAKFDNDPAQFLAFVQNADNIEEMREMGLAPPARPGDAEPDPAPAPVPSTAPEPTPDAPSTPPGT